MPVPLFLAHLKTRHHRPRGQLLWLPLPALPGPRLPLASPAGRVTGSQSHSTTSAVKHNAYVVFSSQKSAACLLTYISVCLLAYISVCLITVVQLVRGNHTEHSQTPDVHSKSKPRFPAPFLQTLPEMITSQKGRSLSPRVCPPTWPLCLTLSAHSVRVQELCESRGGRPGLSVLMSLTVSVDVKQH